VIDKSLRVAVVEDDDTQRKKLATMLSRALTVRSRRGSLSTAVPKITEFDNVIDLLEIIDESQLPMNFPFDVIVADVFMPMQEGTVPHPQGGAIRVYDSIKAHHLDGRVIMLIVSIDLVGAETDVLRIAEEQRDLEYPWAFVLSKPRAVSISPATAGISTEAWLSTVEMLIAHRADQAFRTKDFLRLPPTELLSQPFFAGVKLDVDALIKPGSPQYLLITGEHGTPKVAVAKYFADRMGRSSSPATFILHDGNEESLAAHLFGQQLPEPREGYLELHPADTIFIDDYCLPSRERGVFDRALRILLDSMVDHGLTSGQFYRLEGFQPKTFDGVIVLSCSSLKALRMSGDVDEHLIALLETRHVHIPALRDSPQLIVSLARHFLKKTAPEKMLTRETVKVLRQHRWPGNVVELEEMVTALVHDIEQDWVTPTHLETIGFRVSPVAASSETEPTVQSLWYRFGRSISRVRSNVIQAPTPLKVLGAIIGAILAVCTIVQGVNAWYDLRCKIDPSSCMPRSAPSSPATPASPVITPRSFVPPR
jgi:CheY-like chemotaxis protein